MPKRKEYKIIKLPFDKEAEKMYKRYGDRLYPFRHQAHQTEPTWVNDENSVWSFRGGWIENFG